MDEVGECENCGGVLFVIHSDRLECAECDKSHPWMGGTKARDLVQMLNEAGNKHRRES